MTYMTEIPAVPDFARDYLAAVAAYGALGHALREIGLSGHSDFRRLGEAILCHGAATHRDVHGAA